ncbi:AraC family transcriptional regulator [Anaerocolumna sp.]|uniref:AraC family transcriptional regulator n=1 Tax=Anaerocolumna sp. TaxID=2041569 RepID=UPI0028A9A358|nr:AraC family transcriptional regulator [Anaerocolumna sp.]
MNIDDVIKKSIETPGVSMKRGEYSTELILKQREGKGSMTFLPLFPGITLAYIFVNAPTWPAPNLLIEESNAKGPLIINYCVTGRCELILNSEDFVYLKDGEISLTERFAQKQYIYPRRIYEGLEFFIDIDTVMSQSTYIRQAFDLNLSHFPEVYCQNGKTYISNCTAEIENIFKKLWVLYNANPAYAIFQMRILSLELFGLMLNDMDIPPSQACTFFTATQVDIAKKTEQIITADLRQHHPAWELAASFSISETSLKNYFRGVYGQNISIYLRDARMNKASELLINTQKPIAAIGEQVGYMNQSKFASAFKKQFGLAPLEYRRSKHLDTFFNKKTIYR